MTSDPIIVSIPHSGTRFLKKRLGIEEHVHTHTNWNTLLKRVRGRTIISPLRNPDAVWRSWCRRRNVELDKFPLIEFAAGWYVMHTLAQMFEVDFIPVDKQEDRRIRDWSKVGDRDESAALWKAHRIDLRALYKLPYVQEHYGSWARPVPEEHHG